MAAFLLKLKNASWLSIALFCIFLQSVSATLIGSTDISMSLQRADVAVVGQLVDVKKRAGWGVVHASGYIQVSEVIYGDLQGENLIPINWFITPSIIDYTGDFRNDPGVDKIWFLTIQNGRVVRPSPNQEWEISERAKLLACEKHPLRLSQTRDDSKPMPIINLSYRNLTSGTLTLPKLSYSAGQFQFPEGSEISLEDMGARTITTLQPAVGIVQYTSPTETIDLSPGESYHIEFPITDMFPTAKPKDRLIITLPGGLTSNQLFLTDYEAEDRGDYVYEYIKDDCPLPTKLKILASYPPTANILAIYGVIVGLPATVLLWMFRRRKLPPA